MHLEQFHRRHFGHQHSPRVVLPEIDLLEVLIQQADGELAVLFLDASRKKRWPWPRSGGMIHNRLATMTKKRTYVRRHCRQRGRLRLTHVLVEVSGTANGLTCVVDNEVETVFGREDFAAERLNARCVAQ